MANRNNRGIRTTTIPTTTPVKTFRVTADQSMYEEKTVKTNLRELYIKTWVFRYAIKDYWPTPNTDDSFRFAFCEVAEALNEQILLNPLYRRNNPTPPDPDKILVELADVALMLITALGPQYPIRKVSGIKIESLDDLCTGVSDAWAEYRIRRRNNNPDRWKVVTVGLIQSIADYPGMDLNARLTECLDRILAKHGPEGGLAALTAPIIDTPAAAIMESVLATRDELAKRGEALAALQEAAADEVTA